MAQSPALQIRQVRETTKFFAAVTAMLFASSLMCFASSYFVRPYLNFSGGATIDGLIVDGATSGTQSFTDAARAGNSSVTLGTGEIGVFARIGNGAIPFDDGFVQVAGVMSETFTVRSGAGTSFAFDFYYDGTVDADAKSVPSDPGNYLLLFNAAIGVFRPGVAEWNNWQGLATTTSQELHYDSFSFSQSNPMAEVSESISDFFNFNTDLATDFEQFQVFVSIEAVISTSTPQFVTMDFGNTGTLEFTADPGVEVFSGSGVFPNTTPIPEPTTGLLVLAGLGVLAARRWWRV